MTRNFKQRAAAAKCDFAIGITAQKCLSMDKLLTQTTDKPTISRWVCLLSDPRLETRVGIMGL